jgi:nicotinate dehydrogenase subunit B
MIPPSLQRNPELDTWLRIHTEGTVTVFTGKVEYGQGIKTALARIAAEELDVSLERIRVHMADTAEGPNELYTVGSMSLEESGTALRLAAAEARQHMLELASAELGVPARALRVDDGTVSAPGLELETTWFRVFGGKRFERKVTGTAALKEPGDYKLLGRPGMRIGMEALVTGETVFLQDMVLPGMVHARVVRPPNVGARLSSVDDAPVKSLPGVVAVIRDGSFLAVAADTSVHAIAAAERLRKAALWSGAAALPDETALHAGMRGAQPKSFPVVDGTAVDEPLAPHMTPTGVAQTLRASYTRPFLMHGSIGPSAAVAHEVEGKLTIWSHSQGVAVLRLAIAQALALTPDKLRLVHVEGPGCYGHNGADDVAFDAALVARALPGTPVHLQWSREDEHAWEPFGSAMVVDLEASLDSDGRVADWTHETRSYTHMNRALPYSERTSGLIAAWHRETPMTPPVPRPALAPHAGIHRNADPLYAFPRKRVVKHFLPDAPFRTSSLRALGGFTNVFALESFMDELAHAARLDPVEFRLCHLTDARARDVIRAAAERFGWRPGRSGQGLAFAQYKNQKAWCAVAIQLSVDDATAVIRLDRAVIAADAGQIVDPDGLTNQLEGGLVQAASWTLREQVRFDRTRVTSVDWDSYPILRFDEVPEIETVLIDRPGLPWVGAGEASQGPTAAAIANAVFSATGLRLRDLPLSPERVREAAAG